ncbi:hypothetical protein C8R46DRAFT_1036381 [Mycena filopes]|nr:hypothetical protein C8R46DRAFT_1036381 [Mycena filopes]
MLIFDQERARITAFDTQILGLERSLSRLRLARDVAQVPLDTFKYPVLTLPTDIVCEIFTQFVPPYPLRPPIVGPDSPTLLTQICHLWRDIAVGMPTLWRAIDLSSNYPSISYQADIFEIWLQRSLAAPLSMRIGNPKLGLTIPELIPMIILHRARWEYLEINLLRSELVAIEGPMPLLRQLHLTVDDYRDDSDVSPVALLDVPLLRSVTVRKPTTWHVTHPWAQITSLTMYYIHPEDCTLLLAQTCSLVHCRLYTGKGYHSVLLPQISLPRLETLEMMKWTDPPVEYLDTFVVPALLTLQVPESFLGPHPIERLRSFITNSGCKLQDVVITGEEIKFIHLYRGAFPSINRFSFRRYHRDANSNLLEGYDEIPSYPEMSVTHFPLDLYSPFSQ